MTGEDHINMQRIQTHLRDGRYLILPPAIYQMAVDACREYGFTEAELSQIHESRFLPFRDELA